jgi:hypothetical protein
MRKSELGWNMDIALKMQDFNRLKALQKLTPKNGLCQYGLALIATEPIAHLSAPALAETAHCTPGR